MIRLQSLEEVIVKEVYLDIMLSPLTKAPEFKFICEMHYREEFTSVYRLQETVNRFYVDQQSLNTSEPVLSGKATAMAASSSDQRHRCKAYRHCWRDCPPTVLDNRQKPRNKKWKN